MDPAKKFDDYQNTSSGRFYRCHSADLCLAVLRHHQVVQLFGAFDLQVLYGSVKMHGYKFEAGAYQEDRFLPVCAPYALSPPVALRASTPHTYISSSRLQWRINEVTEATSSVMNWMNKRDGVLLIRFRLPMAVLCARHVYETALFVPKASTSAIFLDPVCCVMRENIPGIPYKSKKEWISVVDFLEQKRGKDETCVMMVTGGKNYGKSTVAKFITNSLLIENQPPVYFLDMDVGQSETNPPGCVSLFKVDNPLLGAPFSSQRKTLVDSYFFGNVSPADNLTLYERLVLKLYERFAAHAFPGSALVINTLGWVEGEGAALLDRLIAKIAPDCLFNIVVGGGGDYSDQVFKEQLHSEHTLAINHWKAFVPTNNLPMPFTFTAATLRDLLIIGYLAPLCPSPSLGSLCNATPYAVPFAGLSIHINNTLGSLPHTHLLAAINCSFMALCSVNWDDANVKGERHILNDKTMHGVVKGNDLELRSFGFGFVRAVDIEKRLLYVLTPVDQKHLGQVNVLSKGANIDIPQTFLAKRHCQEAPYVVCAKNDPSTELYNELAMISCYKWAQSRRKN